MKPPPRSEWTPEEREGFAAAARVMRKGIERARAAERAKAEAAERDRQAEA